MSQIKNVFEGNLRSSRTLKIKTYREFLLQQSEVFS